MNIGHVCFGKEKMAADIVFNNEKSNRRRQAGEQGFYFSTWSKAT